MEKTNHNPLDPDLVAEQRARAQELFYAQESLEAIGELKSCKKGWAYLVERLNQKAAHFQRTALDGATVEERETARRVYLKFRDEIVPMLERDELNHRQTVEGSS